MLEMTPEEERAVQIVWEERGNGNAPIPEDEAKEILAAVRTRVAQIEARAYRLGNSVLAEGRRTPRQEERRAALVFVIAVILVVGAIVIKELLR